MNAVTRSLREFLARRPASVPIALVGGVAISARTEPRFTRDLDFAVAVADDEAAEAYVRHLRDQGYELVTMVEQVARDRLATGRLRLTGRGPFLDLLFASSGIEADIIEAAEPLDIVSGVIAPVARVGHLIAMKLLSRDDDRRPNDLVDLRSLATVADDAEWSRAEDAVRAIEQRGFARNRDLLAALAALRATRP